MEFPGPSTGRRALYVGDDLGWRRERGCRFLLGRVRKVELFVGVAAKERVDLVCVLGAWGDGAAFDGAATAGVGTGRDGFGAWLGHLAGGRERVGL